MNEKKSFGTCSSTKQYEHAARVQSQAAIERSTSQHLSEMEHQLYRIEQIVEQNVSEHNVQILTRMSKLQKGR